MIFLGRKYSHFTDEMNEAQRGQVTSLNKSSCTIGRWGEGQLNCDLPPKPMLLTIIQILLPDIFF